MNIKELHPNEKLVSAVALFQGSVGSVAAIQIRKNEKLKEHITKTPALLLCVEGEAVFENELGVKEKLLSGDFVKIEPMVKHWIEASTDSQLILMK